MKRKKTQFFLSIAVVVAITTTIHPTYASTTEKTSLQKHVKKVDDRPDIDNESRDIVQYQNLLREKQENKQIKAILPYIEKAELSKSGEDLYLAELLIDKLPDKEKAKLLNRLSRIVTTSSVNESQYIKEAEKEVSLAEKNYKNEPQLKKAQKSVLSLKLSKERTELVERLDKIYQIIIKEREDEK